MAVGTRIGSVLESMVRGRIQEFARDLTQSEILSALNSKQMQLFLELPKEIKLTYYVDRSTLTFALDSTSKMLEASLPATYWDFVIVKRIYQVSTDYFREDIGQCLLDELEETIKNPFLSGKPKVCIVGGKIIVSYASAVPSSSTFLLFFIRRPADMATASAAVDIPDLYCESLVVRTASALLNGLEVRNVEGKQMVLQKLVAEQNAIDRTLQLGLDSHKEMAAARLAQSISSGYYSPGERGASPGGGPAPEGG